MKIHAFRLINTEADDQTPIEHKFPLYACTKSKKTAKQFMRERDMSKFIHTIVEKSGEDGDRWMEHFRNNILYEVWLETYDHTDPSEHNKRYAKVLLTDSELSFVMEAIDTSTIVNIMGLEIPYEVFGEKYKKALEILDYPIFFDNAIRFRLDKWEKYSKHELLMEDFDQLDPYPDSIVDFVDFDQLGVFALMYKSQLMPEFFAGIEFRDFPPDGPNNRYRYDWCD